MKRISPLLFSFLFSIQTVFAFQVTPVIEATGQALKFTCSQQASEPCNSLCGKQECLISETFCRSCSGTHELYMKRILDGVGTSIKASLPLPIPTLYTPLTSRSVISLHPQTIYNYSSVYNGAFIQSQFRSLCPALSESALEFGILLIQTDQLGTPSGIIGALCPNEENTDWRLFKTTSRFQNP